ncbi:malate synthase A [Sediminitomix flava]|uniref:Malate synthase n=1 Tax=Sediminitomix flava TaxID=379075 RepID=A0A315Z7R0_SEDFL|nr:malate synthase A [Sediminitomix flava]PWJ40081.1 malate synthase [Sediminitomix flava]
MEMTTTQKLSIDIKGEMKKQYQEILTPAALDFLAELHLRFNNRRLSLLEARVKRQKRIDAGEMPDFLPETEHIREGDWTVAPVPANIQDRRVEITGPVDRKMIINALNSGANVFMADFEDACSPKWENIMDGQINLRDAVNETISYTNPKNGKQYQLNDERAVLFVRPRGWHLEEKNLIIDGKPISGAIMDFGLYFFHNAKTLLEKNSAPYFYLPKMESHMEARLWNHIFVFAQHRLGIPQGSIKGTVLIETILAAFEMDEILYELKDHSAGLNCGRWDYIFSYIKKFRNHSDFILPDRSQVTMTVPFMKAYYELLIKTCHKRKAFAMGGMAAQIPVKGDEEAHLAAIQKVAKDKEREAQAGHDGTWVAHPGLVSTAKGVFDQYMPTPNQLQVLRNDVKEDPHALIEPAKGEVTLHGFKNNMDVAIQYIESWLRGHGAVPIYNLMEDAATAEISRAQLWQWIKNEVKLSNGQTATFALYEELLPEVIAHIQDLVGLEKYNTGMYEKATELLTELVKEQVFNEFLTLKAYSFIK